MLVANAVRRFRYHIHITDAPSALLLPIPVQDFDFNWIQLQATVTPMANLVNRNDYQDVFHLSSPVHPAHLRCGLEFGVRADQWILGLNLGTGNGGYIEVPIPNATVSWGTQQTIFLTKNEHHIQVIIGAATLDWNLGRNDLQSAWLSPEVLIGARADRQDFIWEGAIDEISISSGR
jgi:hypothetical protein